MELRKDTTMALETLYVYSFAVGLVEVPITRTLLTLRLMLSEVVATPEEKQRMRRGTDARAFIPAVVKGAVGTFEDGYRSEFWYSTDRNALKAYLVNLTTEREIAAREHRFAVVRTFSPELYAFAPPNPALDAAVGRVAAGAMARVLTVREEG